MLILLRKSEDGRKCILFQIDRMSLWHATLAWKQSIDLDYILTVAVVCFDQIADFFTL